MAEKFEVIISADSKDLTAELQKAQNSLRQFEAALKKSTNIGEIQYLSRNITLLKSQIDTLNVAQGKLSAGSNKAAYALNDLSRIAQDAPYGFIGISNNINPLLESFQRLQAESKATGQSIGSLLVGALKGPAGLGLAIGVASAAVTFMSVGLSRWGVAAEKTKKITDDLKKSQEDFAKSLDNAKAGALSSGLALQQYINIAKDNTLSIEQRNEALKQANDILGEHGKKITLANVATKEITDQTALYTKALIAQAVATKYTDRIAELTIKQTDLNDKLSKSNKELSNSQDELNTKRNNYAKSNIDAQNIDGRTIRLGGATAKAYDEQGKAAENYYIVLKNNKNLQLELNNTTKELEDLQNKLTVSTNIATESFGKLGYKTKDSGKKIETITSILAEFEAKLYAINKTGIELGTPDFKISEEKIKAFEEVIQKLNTKFGKSEKLKPYIIDLTFRLDEIKKDYINQKIQNAFKEVELQKKLSITFNKSTLNEQISIIKKTFDEVENLIKTPFDPRLIVLKVILNKLEAEKQLEDFKKFQDNIFKEAAIQGTIDIAIKTSDLDVIKNQISAKLENIKNAVKNFTTLEQIIPFIIQAQVELSELKKKEFEAKLKELENTKILFGESNINDVISTIKNKLLELSKEPGFDPNNPYVVDLKLQLQDAEAKKQLEEFKQNTINSFKSFLTDSALNIGTALGEALGAALTGVDARGIFSELFKQLSDGIQKFGENLIKIGILATLAQEALASLITNPFAAITVGIALVALGSALKNLTSKSQFAVGTRYAPGGMALVGERGPELVSLPRGSQVIPAAQTASMMGAASQVEVFGVLRGQDIYFSNKKYGRTYGRTT